MLNDDLETRDCRNTVELQAVKQQLVQETARRVRAEEELRQAQADWGQQLQERTHLIQELQGHQIELETQNETLRRVQTELKAAYNQYADLYDHYATIVHRDGEIIFVNAAAAKLFRAPSAEQLLGQRFWNLVQPNYQEIVAAQIRHFTAPDNIPTLEQKIFRFDGTEAPWPRCVPSF